MGWSIPDIVISACIKQFQKEILVIRISISLPSQGFDFVVDPLHLARGNLVCCMCDDSFKVFVDKVLEPGKQVN